MYLRAGAERAGNRRFDSWSASLSASTETGKGVRLMFASVVDDAVDVGC